MRHLQRARPENRVGIKWLISHCRARSSRRDANPISRAGSIRSRRVVFGGVIAAALLFVAYSVYTDVDAGALYFVFSHVF
jgi:hypothetical protein